MEFSFPDHPVAAISGGLGDIGLATARVLRQAGCRVALGDTLAADNGGQLSDEGYHYGTLDVRDERSIEVWFDAIMNHFGQSASIIVVNAGIVRPGTGLETACEDWNETIAVNLTGAWLTARVGAKRLVSEGSTGRIVFTGSWAGHAPHVNLVAYCAAKAGLRMVVQCMAAELADKGILVNEVAPGYVDAGLSAEMFRRDPGLAERAKASVPVRKLIHADEVAEAIAYLCLPGHRNLTGAALVLDGGLSLLRAPKTQG
jgi:glucose 1-dehydrogenase